MSLKPVIPSAERAYHVIFLRAPVDLIPRIDEFAEAHGYKVRSKAVIRLILEGLNSASAVHAEG